jgi:hypothetical protein
MDCSNHPVPHRILVAGHDRITKPEHASQDPTVPGPAPKYGQDFTYGVGRRAPGGESVGRTEAELKPRMERLLGFFAGKDKKKMARRLFDEFLSKKSIPYYFDDADLNAAASNHDHVIEFCNEAFGAAYPFGPGAPSGQIRIHQALKAANFDISKVQPVPVYLKTPSFNKGSKAFGTGDFGNGLGVMINGIQWAYGIVTHCLHDPSAGMYCLNMKFVFYDVFGIDDDDLRQYGADDAEGQLSLALMAQGITAWWQLQHQFGYAPLVTRCTVHKTFQAPTMWN